VGGLHEQGGEQEKGTEARPPPVRGNTMTQGQNRVDSHPQWGNKRERNPREDKKEDKEGGNGGDSFIQKKDCVVQRSRDHSVVRKSCKELKKKKGWNL